MDPEDRVIKSPGIFRKQEAVLSAGNKFAALRVEGDCQADSQHFRAGSAQSWTRAALNPMPLLCPVLSQNPAHLPPTLCASKSIKGYAYVQRKISLDSVQKCSDRSSLTGMKSPSFQETW